MRMTIRYHRAGVSARPSLARGVVFFGLPGGPMPRRSALVFPLLCAVSAGCGRGEVLPMGAVPPGERPPPPSYVPPTYVPDVDCPPELHCLDLPAAYALHDPMG